MQRESHNASCSAAISACEKGMQWEPALRLLRDVLSKLLQPGLFSCDAAVSACEKGAHWEFALGLLQEIPR